MPPKGGGEYRGVLKGRSHLGSYLSKPIFYSKKLKRRSYFSIFGFFSTDTRFWKYKMISTS